MANPSLGSWKRRKRMNLFKLILKMRLKEHQVKLLFLIAVIEINNKYIEISDYSVKCIANEGCL
jgi:hypothetical protein